MIIFVVDTAGGDLTQRPKEAPILSWSGDIFSAGDSGTCNGYYLRTGEDPSHTHRRSYHTITPASVALYMHPMTTTAAAGGGGGVCCYVAAATTARSSSVLAACSALWMIHDGGIKKVLLLLLLLYECDTTRNAQVTIAAAVPEK